MVPVTRSVVVSITDTEPEPSFDAYAVAASTPPEQSAAMASAHISTRRIATSSVGCACARLQVEHPMPTQTGDVRAICVCYPISTVRRSMPVLVSSRARASFGMLWPHWAGVVASAALPCLANAQDVPGGIGILDPITVTATRRAERAFDVPASVDTLEGAVLHDGQPQVNLSESLSRLPGVFAANRQNYAQDLQISSRGFGARAQFGVRGVRLYQDGIPVTMPDGQGQTGSFSLLSAQRIEVLHGPFSTLYGNASGGVIAVFTEDPQPQPVLDFTFGGGSYGTWTAGTKLNGYAGSVGAVVAATHFQTDGYRDHSSARREIGNAKLVFEPAADTRVTVIANTQYQPETEDPLGLTRAEWEANPRGVDPSAIQFNTRKTIDQIQGGVFAEHRFDDSLMLAVDAYHGTRTIRQYLALAGTLPT